MNRPILALILLSITLVGCDDTNPPPSDLTPSRVENASEYTGEYTRTDGTPIYLAQVKGGLAVVVTGNVFALEATGEDAFEIVGLGEPVSFERDADGSVSAVTDSQGTYPRNADEVPDEVASLFDREEVADYAYQPPSDARPDLPLASAAERGLATDSLESIVDDINRDDDYAHVHSLLVARRGDLVLEEYFAGFDANQPHNLRSATKSVISALVGVAVERGEVSLDDRPLARIAEEAGMELSEHKAQLTVADLIDMRHGLQCDDWDPDSPGNESKIYGEEDWVEFILNIPDAENDPEASYCSAMPLMVGRYLEIVTSEPLPDYATQFLFEPIGIDRNDWQWDFALAARDTPGGGQVYLRPRDMLRFGRLFERDGLSPGGERILPEEWVEQSFTAEMPLGDWRRYNDFWWTYDVEREGAEAVSVHMASGIGGQKIALVPALDLVIVMTGGSFTSGQPGPTRVIERVIRAVSV